MNEQDAEELAWEEQKKRELAWLSQLDNETLVAYREVWLKSFAGRSAVLGILLAEAKANIRGAIRELLPIIGRRR